MGMHPFVPMAMVTGKADVCLVGAAGEAVHDDAGIFFADSGPYWQSLRQAWQTMFHPDR